MADSKATQDTSAMQKIRTFIKRRTKWQIIGFVILVAIVGFVFAGGEGEREEIMVVRGSVEQEVVATGKVRSSEEVDLGFERSGKVVRVNAKVGDAVVAGSTLVVLDQSELLANLKKAKANLSEAQINLDKVKRTTALDSSNAYDKLYIALIDAYTEARDAVLNTGDRFFDNPESHAPKFEVVYASSGQYIEFFVDDDDARALSQSRSEVGTTLNTWALEIDKIRASKGDLTNTVALSEQNIDDVKIFLGDVALVVGTITGSNQTEEGILDGFKASISSTRTSVNSALTDLLSAKAVYLDSPKELTLGSEVNYDSIFEEEAKVDVALAEVESLESQLAKTVLSTPISGIVTKQDAKVGQIVTAGELTTSVISGDALEIAADISEVNIGKILEGNNVSIKLDAFPNETLSGVVSYIEPGEKLVDGVVNYEVTVTFTGVVPQGLKKGLTASLNILTERKDDVLKIPSYAIEKRDGKRFVSLKVGEKVEEREVVTGLSGKDGSIEVVSGLSEGDIVLGATI